MARTSAPHGPGGEAPQPEPRRAFRRRRGTCTNKARPVQRARGHPSPGSVRQTVQSLSDRNFVKYTFIRVDPAWRRLPADERATHKREFAAACQEFADDHYLRTYSLVGTRG